MSYISRPCGEVLYLLTKESTKWLVTAGQLGSLSHKLLPVVSLWTHGGYGWCSRLGFLGIFSPINTPYYRAYIGISHRGMLVWVHPTIP